MSKVVIQGDSIGTGTFTIKAPGSNINTTITLPEISGSLLAVDYNNNVPFIAGGLSIGGDVSIAGSGALTIPVGTTEQRPISPQPGMMRINTSFNSLEFYTLTGWNVVGLKDGSSILSAGDSALAIKNLTGTTANGLYWINLGNGQGPQQVYCIMDDAIDGGGWMVLYSNVAGATDYTFRVSADRHDISANPFTQNYSLSYARRSGVRAICSQNKSLVYRNSTGWMIIRDYIWQSTSHSTGNFLFEFNSTCYTSNGTEDTSIEVGLINYNNSTGGDFGISSNSNGLDHHSTSYYNLNSTCASLYLYQYGAGYKVNTGLTGWSNATNTCLQNNTNDINFLIAMK